jgi:hypothetical protein
MAAQLPPESVQRQQEAGMGSLNAFASGDSVSSKSTGDEDAQGDDLFALPMSPRSPETTTKSPFSFAAHDTMKYLKGETA